MIIREEMTMRFMILVKANEDSEAGVRPSQEWLGAMGNYRLRAQAGAIS